MRSEEQREASRLHGVSAQADGSVVPDKQKLRFMGIESAILAHKIRNHRDMSPEALSDIVRAGLAMRNLTDRQDFPSSSLPRRPGAKLQYSRALRRLVESQAICAKMFHPAQPGVPESGILKSMENQDPPA